MSMSVETGLIYGAYHYTDALGLKLGHVPIIIPIAWFMMIYPSYIIANLIGSGRQMMGDKNNYSNNPTTLVQILWLSFLSAVIMTAWDLVVDPYLSGPTERAWIWEGWGLVHGSLNFTNTYCMFGKISAIVRKAKWHKSRRPHGAVYDT